MAFRLAFEKAFEDIADSRWSARKAGRLVGGGAFLIFFFEAAASNICLPSFRPSFLLQRLSWRQTMTIEMKRMMLTSK